MCVVVVYYAFSSIVTSYSFFFTSLRPPLKIAMWLIYGFQLVLQWTCVESLCLTPIAKTSPAKEKISTADFDKMHQFILSPSGDSNYGLNGVAVF